MKPPAEQEVRQALVRAEDALDTAAYNLKGGFLLATVNRAYYACFYCMTALLYTEGVQAKTHQGTHIKFFDHFIKTAMFPHSMGAFVKVLFSKRQAADYELDAAISTDEAEDLVNKSREFYRSVSEYLDDWKSDLSSM